jgi:hypothetical protein
VLRHNTQYYWKIQAWNDSGFAGMYSSVGWFTTAPVARPTIATPRLMGTSFSVAVFTELGVNYSLEYKQSLCGQAWIPVQGGSGSGTGNQIILTDPSATWSARVYRISAAETL